MNWGIFSRTLSFIPLLGPIVNGIEQIHKEAGTPGATKKQLALDSLALATGAAGAALPQFAPEIQAATALAGGAIDLIVAGYNQFGWPDHVAPELIPATPAAQPTDTKKLPGSPAIRVIG